MFRLLTFWLTADGTLPIFYAAIAQPIEVAAIAFTEFSCIQPIRRPNNDE